MPYVILGKYGGLYQKSFFHKFFFDYNKYLKLCPFADDLWIASHLYKKGCSAILANMTIKEYIDIKIKFSQTLFGSINFEAGNDIALKNLTHIFYNKD